MCVHLIHLIEVVVKYVCSSDYIVMLELLSLALTRRFFLALGLRLAFSKISCLDLLQAQQRNELSHLAFFCCFFCCNLLRFMTNLYFCVIHDEITHCDTKAMTKQIC